MRGYTFLIFVFMTVCCWGIYGPVLHEGQLGMGEGQIARWKPYMCVGIAYFLIAVIIPVTILTTKGEKGNWTVGGFFWSFFAGCIAATGALGIISAFNFDGQPVFVMPLVFGCAPVINTFMTMLMARTIGKASAVFFIGVLVVAIGGAGVMVFKPKEPKEPKGDSARATSSSPLREVTHRKPSSTIAAQQSEGASSENEGSGNSSSANSDAAGGSADESESGELPPLAKWFFMLASIGLTAVCWGSYGPVLHKGQFKMHGSRMRPYLCVGLAYFVIAVMVPIPMLPDDPGSWNFNGTSWALLGGTCGALGALGIISAFNFGGKPIFVMPLVFGGAPVINTLSTTIAKGLWGQVTWPFLISLALVIGGAVTVLVTAPRAKPKPKVEVGGRD